MKKLLLSLILISSFGLKAEDGVIIKNACYSGCTEKQYQIWDAFEAGTEFRQDFDEKMYSGNCYHKSGLYNPNDAHHGGIFVENIEGKTYFNGRFSFYARTNPYAGWSVERAKQEFTNRYESTKVLTHYSDFSFIDFNPSGEPPIWRYWMRNSTDAQGEETLVVMALWGIHHTVFCELKEN